jgi:hypothetical protein
LLAATFLTGFGAGLAGLFFSALRALAAGAGLARPGVDDFDFAAFFLNFDAALAMTCNQSARGEEVRALHHVSAVPRKAGASDFKGFNATDAAI